MKEILTNAVAESKLKRMALEVAERNYPADEIILIGIRENGPTIASIIARHLKEVFSGKVTLLELTMNKKDPAEIQLNEAVSLNHKNVLLIDDVASSGKTFFYALQPLLQQKPAQVETLALIERTHKKFPIAINYAGMSVSTTLEEHIEVGVGEGKVTGAWLK